MLDSYLCVQKIHFFVFRKEGNIWSQLFFDYSGLLKVNVLFSSLSFLSLWGFWSFLFFFSPIGFTWFTLGGKAEFLDLLSCTGNERNTRQKGWLGLHTFAYNLAPVQGETGRAGDFPKAPRLECSSFWNQAQVWGMGSRWLSVCSRAGSRLWRFPVLNYAVILSLYVLQNKTILNCKTRVRKFN